MSENIAVEIAKLEGAMRKSYELIDGQVKTMKGQLEESGSIATEAKNKLDKFIEDNKNVLDRIKELEQKAIKNAQAYDDREDIKTIGQRFVESDQFKSYRSSGSRSVKMEFDGTNLTRESWRCEAKAIINATGQNQPLVPAQRLPGIITPLERRLTVRDVLPVGTTSSNLIEYVKENVFTNSAAPQHSGGAFENVAKAESNITFTLATASITTLAHWIAASKQVLSDAPMLQSYIEGRLMYGLKLEEEDELMNGSGAAGELSGLLLSGNYTAFNRSVRGSDTSIDLVRKGKLQLRLSEFDATACFMHPSDWENIEGTKDSQGRYLLGNPQGTLNPTLWGVPIIPTVAIAEGSILLGDYRYAAQIWDRQQMAVSVSSEHSDFFTKNMVAILAEERLGLAVYRPSAQVLIPISQVSPA
jgi:HK97 family phage major capsid protein